MGQSIQKVTPDLDRRDDRLTEYSSSVSYSYSEDLLWFVQYLKDSPKGTKTTRKAKIFLTVILFLLFSSFYMFYYLQSNSIF